MSPFKDGGLTVKEQTFSLTFFKTKNKVYSMKKAGYPTGLSNREDRSNRAVRHADVILKRPRVKAYIRKLWEESESPVTMSVRERKEILSQIGRGMIGNCLDEGGNIDLAAIRAMPAVSSVDIFEGKKGRTIKVKLLNPVESIHELNLMEKLYRINEAPVNINPVYNYFLTGPEVKEGLERMGGRTREAIELTGEKVEEVVENDKTDTE